EDESRKSQHRDKRDQTAPLGRHLNRVIVETADDVGAAADERLQRLRTAGEILQLDVEPFLAIEPELLRERRRQVDHLILAADRDPDAVAGRFAALTRAGGDTDKDAKGNKGHKGVCHHHCFQRSNHRSSRVTPALTMTTTTPSTVIPAKTPVVSNVPSACEIT